MRNLYINYFILFAFILGACTPTASIGKSNSPEDSIHSIAEIIEQPLKVTAFENDGSATLPIDTTIPVACSIVYGRTPQFGSISVDQDMSSGAHTDHSPLLVGLDPETTYYFRVQGVDASGKIYLSEVMTFTTPTRETVVVENLASPLLGAEIIGYSSAFGDAAPSASWGIANAFDDNPNTAWSSAGDGNDAWVEVKLAQPARVTAVSFHSRSMADGSAITRAFTVTTEKGQVFGPFSLPDASQSHQFEVAFEAQTLKFELVETTGGNTGVMDIAVYGSFLK